jgi:hypothetical protein
MICLYIYEIVIRYLIYQWEENKQSIKQLLRRETKSSSLKTKSLKRFKNGIRRSSKEIMEIILLQEVARQHWLLNRNKVLRE